MKYNYFNLEKEEDCDLYFEWKKPGSGDYGVHTGWPRTESVPQRCSVWPSQCWDSLLQLKWTVSGSKAMGWSWNPVIPVKQTPLDAEWRLPTSRCTGISCFVCMAQPHTFTSLPHCCRMWVCQPREGISPPPVFTWHETYFILETSSGREHKRSSGSSEPSDF